MREQEPSKLMSSESEDIMRGVSRPVDSRSLAEVLSQGRYVAAHLVLGSHEPPPTAVLPRVIQVALQASPMGCIQTIAASRYPAQDLDRLQCRNPSRTRRPHCWVHARKPDDPPRWAGQSRQRKTVDAEALLLALWVIERCSVGPSRAAGATCCAAGRGRKGRCC